MGKVILKCSLFFCCFYSCLSFTPVTVNTNVGSIIGFEDYITIDHEQKIISKFVGIPFAESTAGSNRFMKPIPKAPFKTTFNASKTPAACYQQFVEEMSSLNNIPGVPGFSEDCLTLNIYVPNRLKSSSKLPVMVWVHGGGFTKGTASMYMPETLSIFGNVIVVTVNYRLGMFGFLRDNNGHFPGNQGLWDQHLAIKWVHDNIDNFCGNKDEITIFGESAGGDSVVLQAIYPGNKGLFKRVIAESGTPLSSRSTRNVSSFENYLTAIGCEHHANVVACMQTKDIMSLLSNSTSFGPTVDGEFLLASPEEILKGTGRTAKARNFFVSLDIVIGVNNMDGLLIYGFWQHLLGHTDPNFNITREDFTEKIIPWFVINKLNVSDGELRRVLNEMIAFLYTNWPDPNNVINVRRNVIDFSNDILFFAPAIRTAQGHATINKGKTYFYEYAFQTKNHIFPVPSWLTGSIHADEVQFVLGYPLRQNFSPINYTTEEKQVSRVTMTFWSNFAKSGNPNLPVDLTDSIHTTWPTYTSSSQSYLKVSNLMSSTSVMQYFHARRIAFWAEVVPTLLRTTVHSPT